MHVLVPPFLKQRDLFSTREAAAAGLDAGDLRKAVHQRQLVRLKRGWYTAQRTRFPEELHTLLVRAELRDNRHTVASHYSGAVLLGLPVHRVDWRTVHLMTRRDVETTRRPGLRLHQSFDDEGLLRQDCVSVGLACVQTALLDPVSGLMAADHALRQGLTSRSDLERVVHRMGRQRGARLARATLALASAVRESPMESRLAFALHVLGYTWVEQVTIRTALGVCRPDFQIKGTRVLVEYDGEDKYADRGSLLQEKRREDALRALGYDFVRVTRHLLDDLPALDQQIRHKLKIASSAHQA